MHIPPYLVLTRPANLLTAAADILAGAAITGFFSQHLNTSTWLSLLALLTASVALYAGSVVFNDFFDAEPDRQQRPERPIPSGMVSRNNAAILGTSLFIIGIISASLVSNQSTLLALSIIAFALVYNSWGKHHVIVGPALMGLCRACNLLLGMSLITNGLFHNWPISGLPLLFVAAITLTSQGEVIGNNRLSIILAAVLDMTVLGVLLWLGMSKNIQFFSLLPFLLLWSGMNLRTKYQAITSNHPANIMRAVKTSVISLIPLDACYAVIFSNGSIALLILVLLPFSILLSKYFAVT